MKTPNCEYLPARVFTPESVFWTVAQVKGIICNPVYAGGMGPYPHPGIVSDETWVAMAVKAIKEDGAEQFLVNMLYVLRKSL